MLQIFSHEFWVSNPLCGQYPHLPALCDNYASLLCSLTAPMPKINRRFLLTYICRCHAISDRYKLSRPGHRSHTAINIPSLPGPTVVLVSSVKEYKQADQRKTSHPLRPSISCQTKPLQQLNSGSRPGGAPRH